MALSFQLAHENHLLLSSGRLQSSKVFISVQELFLKQGMK